jgi:cell wall-associated NlpC family hydrolase
LDGPTVPLDPRTHAFRSDLADISLAGQRMAPHYVRAEPARCIARSAMVQAQPGTDAPAVSQLLHGEAFHLLDRAGGWAWGRCAHDGYVGYVPEAALGPAEPATHRVVAPLALLFAGPNIKDRVLGTRAIGSLLSGTEADGFLRTAYGYVHGRHVRPLAEQEPDWTAVAERLLGLPYRWGGRGDEGIDCSGLVQVALSLAGRDALRDSDQQRDGLGVALAPDAPLARGDLVFFPGHVGIMVDGERLIHANAWWMAVAIEPLAAVVARLATTEAEPIIGRRRLEG